MSVARRARPHRVLRLAAHSAPEVLSISNAPSAPEPPHVPTFHSARLRERFEHQHEAYLRHELELEAVRQ